MKSMILHPTSTAQWQALLNEAQQSCSIYLKEDLEAYLVYLLMRFTGEPAIASSVLGLDFLHGYQRLGHSHQTQLLKDVGDKCLLYAGLFPGRAHKRRVKLSYYVKLGQSAYSTLSNYLVSQEALFIQLCLEFPKLMDILHAMRENDDSAVNLLQCLEWWHETGSRAAWQKLCQATHGFPVPPNKQQH